MFVKGKQIVVYAKNTKGKLHFFKIYNYPEQEEQAHIQFLELFKKDSLIAYSMTIEQFSKLI